MVHVWRDSRTKKQLSMPGEGCTIAPFQARELDMVPCDMVPEG